MSAVPLSCSIFPIHISIFHYAPQDYTASFSVSFLYHRADAAAVGRGEFYQFLVMGCQFFFSYSAIYKG